MDTREHLTPSGQFIPWPTPRLVPSSPALPAFVATLPAPSAAVSLSSPVATSPVPAAAYAVWDDSADLQLRSLFSSGLTPAEIASRMGRSPNSIRSRVRKLHIRK